MARKYTVIIIIIVIMTRPWEGFNTGHHVWLEPGCRMNTPSLLYPCGGGHRSAPQHTPPKPAQCGGHGSGQDPAGGIQCHL